MRLRFVPFVLVALTLGGLLSSCDIAYNNYVGRVYDGASGDRLTGYTIFAEYWKSSIEGDVDDAGRYTVPKVPEDNDFSILIAKDGYRSFMAHQAMFDGGDCDDCPDETKTYYYDAYLFPEGLPSPAVTHDINLALTDAEAAGLIRLMPNADPSLYDATTAPVGVDNGLIDGRQIWINDDDLQFRSVVKTFSGGQVTFEEGELVYGVQYNITIFDVDGYEDLDGITYTAGNQGHQAWTLQPSGFTDLEIVFNSTELGLWQSDGSAVIVFNQPIQFFGEERIEFYEEELDDNTTIDSPDVDGEEDDETASGCEDDDDDNPLFPDDDGNCPDGDRNILSNDTDPDDDEDDGQENGTDMSIEDNRLYITWSDSGLGDEDSGDPILSITYGGLNSIDIVSTRGPITNRDSIGGLLGSGSLTVQMLP